ncbi:hypothetical protein PLICRDRAFT_124522 [Plicaturopsis crispa FD-325 SS-3]|nr:hypothetical protein PLICRDRAFT_124522 [Plicaturopsis crispa FD-325 SS-3]
MSFTNPRLLLVFSLAHTARAQYGSPYYNNGNNTGLAGRAIGGIVIAVVLALALCFCGLAARKRRRASQTMFGHTQNIPGPIGFFRPGKQEPAPPYQANNPNPNPNLNLPTQYSSGQPQYATGQPSYGAGQPSYSGPGQAGQVPQSYQGNSYSAPVYPPPPATQSGDEPPAYGQEPKPTYAPPTGPPPPPAAHPSGETGHYVGGFREHQ